MICGTAGEVKRVAEILESIDQPGKVIHLTVEVVVESTGKAVSTDHMEFSTIDDNVARLQFGEQVSITTGGMQLRNGQPVRQQTREHVGTMVTITPRIAGDEILVNLEIEKSWFDRAGEDVASESRTASFSSTIALKPGVPESIVAKTGQNTPAATSVTMTVTASFEKAAGEKNQGDLKAH